MQRPDLLFLCHRIPYPPNKGDKIRSWHILDYLTQHYRVHLGCFVDQPADWQHVELLRARCGGDCHFAALEPRAGRLTSLTGLATGEPLSLVYYRNRSLMAWARRILSEVRPEVVFVFCSTMAQYVGAGAGPRRILDLVDIDSDKWTQYAGRHSGPMRWIYAREGRLLAAYEQSLADRFDAVLLVSQNEAELFRRQAPRAAGHVHQLNNGVDLDYFSPERSYSDPFAHAVAPIVFTGAMDYWPNIDAVCWFADAVLPLVRRQRPDASLVVVGSEPAAAVRRLAERPGIIVTGPVPDVRPYLAHAQAVIAPMRVARGVQNKVLEAMAMGKSAIVSTMATQGLETSCAAELAIADEPAAIAAAVTAALREPLSAAESRRVRQRVLEAYSWSGNLARLQAIIDGLPAETAGIDFSARRACR